ncbi:MAG: FHA domain-containing protein [Acidobacteria bacterium]|nr:FHA domain-containing protein [Acidobacteriota bacterium]
MSGQPPPEGARAPGARPRTDVASTLPVSARVHLGAHAALDFASLEVVAGRASRMKLRLDQVKIRFGRSPDNDVVLEDEAASRFHAEITFADGGYVVTDLKSSNGVFVDGQRVERAVLKSGARILFGKTEMVFTAVESAVPLSERLELLGRWEVLRELGREDRESLARGLAVRTVPAGAVVRRQDARLDAVLFVVAGQVRVVEVNDEGGERTIGTLVRGDHFGERALLPGQTSACALIAATQACLLELPQERLAQLVKAQPGVNATVVNEVRTRLRTGPHAKVAAERRPDTLAHLVQAADVEIVGQDPRLLSARKKLEAAAKEGQAALVVGQAGTGKRTFARHYHAVSPQAGEPYLEVSLAEIEPVAVEATIFGIDADPDVHDAVGKPGWLEMLGSGTLVLGHAERLDAHQQHKLATYLKLGWFHRVYGQMSVKARTRIVLLVEAPTEAEAIGRLIPELAEPLKERLAFLPPLAQRLKDIPLLAEHYMRLLARREGRKAAPFSREATDKMVSYAWPGNVTELVNVIQRAAIVASEATIIPDNLIFVAPSEKEIHRLNLLRNDRMRAVLRSPWLMKGFMWFNIALVGLVTVLTLYGGLRGAGHPMNEFGNNFGMLVTWLVWFPLLPISAFLIGRIWCGMCPIVGVGDLASRLVKFELPVPKLFKKMDFWLVVISFVLLDFVEELLGVADAPLATATLLVAIIGMSVLFCILYERKTFCRYLCPLAGMLGAYSTMSLVEVRGNKKVCQTQCGQHTCFKGTDEVAGCPMFSYPASITTNVECMMCTNCLRSCDNRGVQVNLRPPLSELWRNATPMLSMSVFGVMLVGLMARHQFPDLTSWQRIAGGLGWKEGVTHTVLWAAALALAVVPFLLASTLSAAASQETLKKNMALYGMAFIPLAFSGHLAHVAHEFLGDGVYALLGYFVRLFDSLFRGVPMAASTFAFVPFVPGPVITFVKFLTVTGGVLGSLVALVMIARKVSERNVFARILPHLLLLFAFWAGYLVIFTGSTAPPPPTAAAQSDAPVTTVRLVGR